MSLERFINQLARKIKSSKKSNRTPRRQFRFEGLERRDLLSAVPGIVSVDGDTLSIQGTDGIDQAYVYQIGQDKVSLHTSFNGGPMQAQQLDISGIKHVVFKGDGGDDVFLNTSRLQVEAHGGDGNDSLTGGPMADQLFGDQGNDILNGKAGNDMLDGGAGQNQIDGGAGNNTVLDWTEAGDSQPSVDTKDIETLLNSLDEVPKDFEVVADVPDRAKPELHEIETATLLPLVDDTIAKPNDQTQKPQLPVQDPTKSIADGLVGSVGGPGAGIPGTGGMDKIGSIVGGEFRPIGGGRIESGFPGNPSTGYGGSVNPFKNYLDGLDGPGHNGKDQYGQDILRPGAAAVAGGGTYKNFRQFPKDNVKTPSNGNSGDPGMLPETFYEHIMPALTGATAAEVDKRGGVEAELWNYLYDNQDVKFDVHKFSDGHYQVTVQSEYAPVTYEVFPNGQTQFRYGNGKWQTLPADFKEPSQLNLVFGGDDTYAAAEAKTGGVSYHGIGGHTSESTGGYQPPSGFSMSSELERLYGGTEEEPAKGWNAKPSTSEKSDYLSGDEGADDSAQETSKAVQKEADDPVQQMLDDSAIGGDTNEGGETSQDNNSSDSGDAGVPEQPGNGRTTDDSGDSDESPNSHREVYDRSARQAVDTESPVDSKPGLSQVGDPPPENNANDSDTGASNGNRQNGVSGPSADAGPVDGGQGDGGNGGVGDPVDGDDNGDSPDKPMIAKSPGAGLLDPPIEMNAAQEGRLLAIDAAFALWG